MRGRIRAAIALEIEAAPLANNALFEGVKIGIFGVSKADFIELLGFPIEISQDFNSRRSTRCCQAGPQR